MNFLGERIKAKAERFCVRMALCDSPLEGGGGVCSLHANNTPLHPHCQSRTRSRGQFILAKAFNLCEFHPPHKLDGNEFILHHCRWLQPTE